MQTAVVADGIRTTLEANDVPADEIAQILNPKPVPVETLEPQDPNRETNSTVAFIAVVLLYGQLFGYGVWVATGVIEEKASRVVEILLSTIRARQLLAGKILGIGTLGLLQLIVIATYSIVLASVTGALDFPAHALGTAALAIGWFMLGFAFYASLFAVAGALVSRMEELQNVIVPLNLVILVSFFLAIGATSDPDSTLSVIVSIVPFSSALGHARADLARRGHAVRDRRGARRVDRIDGAADPARRPGLLGSGAAHGRPREAPRGLALRATRATVRARNSRTGSADALQVRLAQRFEREIGRSHLGDRLLGEHDLGRADAVGDAGGHDHGPAVEVAVAEDDGPGVHAHAQRRKLRLGCGADELQPGARGAGRAVEVEHRAVAQELHDAPSWRAVVTRSDSARRSAIRAAPSSRAPR